MSNHHLNAAIDKFQSLLRKLDPSFRRLFRSTYYDSLTKEGDVRGGLIFLHHLLLEFSPLIASGKCVMIATPATCPHHITSPKQLDIFPLLPPLPLIIHSLSITGLTSLFLGCRLCEQSMASLIQYHYSTFSSRSFSYHVPDSFILHRTTSQCLI